MIQKKYRNVLLSPESRVLDLNATVKNWSELRDNLGAYLLDINAGRHGQVAPNTEGIFAIYRRYIQTDIFAELGVTSKSGYNYGMVMNPVVDGKVSKYAIPIAIDISATKGKTPSIRYSTFEYEAWGQCHDQLLHSMSPNPTEMAKRIVPVNIDGWAQFKLHRLSADSSNLSQDSDFVSNGINELLLANIRKYATTEGPHFYNMPLIQATLFDGGLNDDVYHRYLLVHNTKVVGYFVSEVTENFFTITHCLMDDERLDLLGWTVKNCLLMVLRTMIDKDPTTRFKVLHKSKLLNRYVIGAKDYL